MSFVLVAGGLESLDDFRYRWDEMICHSPSKETGIPCSAV
ncbi:hypothetical protein K227x_23780 [Rubripirellula lacrimiformis]|uniref:Uncharacterized protein n=1 Tax=Rubripirellula lacrimiformis TaxID=1930273 RepID=A0A517NA37_9BACT|nr:hypothetical protein K227x_23780 [Rubripirellula lacrimiformis]